jgi:hypothetical protein
MTNITEQSLKPQGFTCGQSPRLVLCFKRRDSYRSLQGAAPMDSPTIQGEDAATGTPPLLSVTGEASIAESYC